MMAFRRTVLKNCFGQHYLFSVGSHSVAQRSISPLIFSSYLSTERFLRSISTDKQYWLRLADSLCTESCFHSPLSLVANKMMQRRLFVYVLPSDYEVRSKTVPIKCTQSSTNEHFKIVPAVEALLSNKSQPEDMTRSLELIESFDLSEQELNDLMKPLKDTSIEATHDNSKSLKVQLKKAILDGELIILSLGSPGMPKTKVLESVDSKPVPLTPEVKPWIQIKLVDEDGKVVPEQKYWIKDANGTEHAGTTDKKGIARLDNIADGNCEISFTELEGWS